MGFAICFRQRVEHPFRWIGATVVSILCVYSLLFGTVILERYLHRSVPLENVLWTASPDYKVFYGPGTKPSLALATYLQMVKASGYLDDKFEFPSKPFFINSALSNSSDSREPFMILPFNEQAGLKLRRDYRERVLGSTPPGNGKKETSVQFASEPKPTAAQDFNAVQNAVPSMIEGIPDELLAKSILVKLRVEETSKVNSSVQYQIVLENKLPSEVAFRVKSKVTPFFVFVYRQGSSMPINAEHGIILRRDPSRTTGVDEDLKLLPDEKKEFSGTILNQDGSPFQLKSGTYTVVAQLPIVSPSDPAKRALQLKSPLESIEVK